MKLSGDTWCTTKTGWRSFGLMLHRPFSHSAEERSSLSSVFWLALYRVYPKSSSGTLPDFEYFRSLPATTLGGAFGVPLRVSDLGPSFWTPQTCERMMCHSLRHGMRSRACARAYPKMPSLIQLVAGLPGPGFLELRQGPPQDKATEVSQQKHTVGVFRPETSFHPSCPECLRPCRRSALKSCRRTCKSCWC